MFGYFFKSKPIFAPTMSDEDKQDSRETLLRQLIANYHSLRELSDNSSEYQMFLNTFCSHIHTLNDCSNDPVQVMFLILATAHVNFGSKPNYNEIDKILTLCTSDVISATNIGKSRPRKNADCELEAIINNAIRVCYMPSIIAAAALAVYLTTSLWIPALILAGAALAAALLGQFMYWRYAYARYQHLNTQIINDDFEPDYASGYILHATRLPPLPFGTDSYIEQIKQTGGVILNHMPRARSSNP